MQSNPIDFLTEIIENPSMNCYFHTRMVKRGLGYPNLQKPRLATLVAKPRVQTVKNQRLSGKSLAFRSLLGQDEKQHEFRSLYVSTNRSVISLPHKRIFTALKAANY